MPRSRKKWLSESKKRQLIDDYVITCCSTDPPALDKLAEGKLPNELVSKAREKLGEVMLELALVREKARRPEDIPADIRPLVERIFGVKGFEPEDTDSHRRRWRPDRIEKEEEWDDI
ncbi:hypothetical protein JW752_03650 [Candidatus Peregrinibacteria bacterium]|nr:hypothetical protein [Candidatus Peregrinibacteria bacterium]